MSNLSEPVDREAALAVNALTQLCVVRAWLATLLTQTLQGEATIKYRIASLEQEAQGLRTQLDHQTTPAIESLRQSIHSVDEAIRRRRDEAHSAVTTQPSQMETEREKPVESSSQGRRSGRRKDG